MGISFYKQHSFHTFSQPSCPLGGSLRSSSNEKCSRVAEPVGHSRMEVVWCLSKCQNGIWMCCTLAVSHSVWVRLVESMCVKEKIKRKKATETTCAIVNYQARALLRHKKCTRVFVLLPSHTAAEHTLHPASWEIIRSRRSFSQCGISCIFMAGASCILTVVVVLSPSEGRTKLTYLDKIPPDW